MLSHTDCSQLNDQVSFKLPVLCDIHLRVLVKTFVKANLFCNYQFSYSKVIGFIYFISCFKQFYKCLRTTERS